MGDNFVTILFLIIIPLGVFMLFFIWVIYPEIESSYLDNFCIEEGFDKGEYGKTVLIDSYCLKQEGKNIVRIMVKPCPDGNGYCFVKG